MGGLVARLDRPVVCLLFSVLLVGALVARAYEFHDRDVSKFVVAGTQWTDPARVPNNLTLQDDPGYDGQFFYRMSSSPFSRAAVVRGVRFDAPSYRAQRIMYPVLAWVGSFGGQRALVPGAMVAVNATGLVLMGFLGSLLAVRLGRHALWGLLFAAYPGFALTLARNTSEIVAGVFLLGGVLLLRTRRAPWAAAPLALAVLSRDTTVLFPAVLALVWVVRRWRRPDEDRPPVVTWTVPLAVYAVWQVVLRTWWNAWPPDGAPHNFGTPLGGIGRSLSRVLPPDSGPELRVLISVVVAVALLALVALAVVRGRAPAPERLAAAAYTLLALSLSLLVWVEDWAYLRILVETYLIGIVVVLASGLRRVAVAIVVANGVLLMASEYGYHHSF